MQPGTWAAVAGCYSEVCEYLQLLRIYYEYISIKQE